MPGTVPYKQNNVVTVQSGNYHVKAWNNGKKILDVQNSDAFSWTLNSMKVMATNHPGRGLNDGRLNEILIYNEIDTGIENQLF